MTKKHQAGKAAIFPVVIAVLVGAVNAGYAGNYELAALGGIAGLGLFGAYMALDTKHVASLLPGNSEEQLQQMLAGLNDEQVQKAVEKLAGAIETPGDGNTGN